MSFVGTRPEAIKYVEMYEPEYMASLAIVSARREVDNFFICSFFLYVDECYD